MNIFEVAEQRKGVKPYPDLETFEQLFEEMLGVPPEYDADMSYYPKVGGIEFDVYRIGNRRSLSARIAPLDFRRLENIDELLYMQSDEYILMVAEAEKVEEEQRAKANKHPEHVAAVAERIRGPR